MPTKYWAKIDGGVEGPYDPVVLRFIDGFSPDILVSPDGPEGEESWVPVSEVSELQTLLNLTAKAGAVPKVIEPQAAPKENGELQATIEEVWVVEEILPGPDPDKTLEIPPKPPVETAPQPQAEAPAPSEQNSPREDFVSTSDMLDLMAKISEEMNEKKKREQEQPKAVPPAAQPARAAAQIPAPAAKSLPAPKVKRIPKVPKVPVFIALGLLIAGGFAFWAVKNGKIADWKNRLVMKFHREKVITPAPLPVVSAPTHRERHKRTRNKETKALAELPRPAEKKQEKPEKPAPEEKELENQKFFLPGVPSPKLSAVKIRNDAPTPRTENKKAIPENQTQEERKNEKPNPKTAKSDWMNQSDWGN